MGKNYKYVRAGDNAIEVNGSGNRFYKVGVSPEGIVRRLIFRQLDGEAAVAYGLDLFDSQIMVEGHHATALPVNAIHYKVIPTQAKTAGQEVIIQPEDGIEYSYANSDGNSSTRPRCLWLHIRPTGVATATHWELSILVANDIG